MNVTTPWLAIHARRHSWAPVPCALVAILVAAACRSDGSAATASLDSVVTWADRIDLEETSDVMNVFPIVRLDPAGGFLVVDPHECQFRRYDRKGKLLAHFGSKGRGPEQFERPTVAIRLPSREIMVVDRRVKVSILDSTGTRLVRTLATHLGPIEDADVVDDSTVLLAGPASANPDSPMLHLWNYRRNEVRRSFFRPWSSYRYKDVASSAGWVQVAIRGDTIAATFSPSDTVYLFGIDGTDLATIPIPSSHFRRPYPLANASEANMQTRNKWLSTFDLVAAVSWAGSDGFLVPYQTFVNGQPVWKMLGLRRAGDLWFDDPDAPRLLTADSAGEELVFVDPGANVPNRWRVASLRRRS